jgi:hypothetical protein
MDSTTRPQHEQGPTPSAAPAPVQPSLPSLRMLDLAQLRRVALAGLSTSLPARTLPPALPHSFELDGDLPDTSPVARVARVERTSLRRPCGAGRTFREEALGWRLEGHSGPLQLPSQGGRYIMN